MISKISCIQAGRDTSRVIEMTFVLWKTYSSKGKTSIKNLAFFLFNFFFMKTLIVSFFKKDFVEMFSFAIVC